jgi:hypothetical protein
MRFLTPAELRGFGAGSLEDLLVTRELVVAFGEGELRGPAAAALLFADYAVLRRDSSLAIDTPEGWAGVVWRAGRRALAARQEDLVDEITEHDEETWRGNWIRGRSVLALDSAAVLIRARGGDALERAEFASLFAAGEPQKGLGAFLAKKSPRYS